MPSTMPIRLRHLVPAIHRPPGARKFRHGVIQVDTEACIVEDDPGNFRSVLPAAFQGAERYLADPAGRPWRILGVLSGSMEPIDTATFLAGLTGATEGYGPHADFGRCLSLRRTPLATPIGLRGRQASGEVREEFDKQARTALLAFLEDDLRIAGDKVLIRALPLSQAILSPLGLAEPRLATARSDVNVHPFSTAFFTLDRIDADIVDYWDGTRTPFVATDEFRAYRDAFDHGPDGNLDARELALALPEAVLDWLDMHERRSIHRKPAGIDSRTRETLFRWALITQFGIMPDEGVIEVLLACARVLEAICEARCSLMTYPTGPLVRHIRERVVPRVEGAWVLPDIDAVALSSLSNADRAKASEA